MVVANVVAAAKCKKLKRSQLGLCLAEAGPGRARPGRDRSYVFGKPAYVVTAILNLFIVFFYLFFSVFFVFCCQGEASTQGEVINYVSLQLFVRRVSVFYGHATARPL